MDIRVKCTTCKKSLPATPQQITDARAFGCFFSTCCNAVATVDRVEVKQPRARKAR